MIIYFLLWSFRPFVAMSDSTIAVIIAAIPLTITSVAGLIVSIRNGSKSDVIAKAVNGTASEMREELRTAHQRVAKLTEQLSKLNK